MNRLFSYISVVLLFFSAAGCSLDEPSDAMLSGDTVEMRFSVAVDGMKTIETRSVDPDGEEISVLWLFLFDENRQYVGHVRAQSLVHGDAGADGASAGSFSASVVSSVRYVHFVANYNSSDIDDSEYIGRTDAEVMTMFTSSSGRLVYWGYEHFGSADELAAFASGASAPVRMYRNQASITYTVASDGILVNGFAVCNKYARGTVAPYNPDSPDPFEFSLDLPYVTLCARDEAVKATDPTETIVMNEWGLRYVFEHDNSPDDQIYTIFNISLDGGSTWRYYKLLICDEDGNPYRIIRNHRYVFRFNGIPSSLGYMTFAEAADGIPANNVWVSIDEELPVIGDGSTRLSIDGETTRIYTARADEKIYFSYMASDGSAAGTLSDISAEWLSNEGIADENLALDYDETSGAGSVTISLNELGDTPQYGTLRIRAGKYFRNIDIIYLRNFDFSPIWMTTSIAERKGEAVSIMFTIPEDYPQSLLPVECKISCDLFDASPSQQLDVVVEETVFNVDGETVEKDWNYKYVYYADSPGAHRVDFITASDRFPDDGAWFLEAPYFNTVRRSIFSVPAQNVDQKILFSNGTGSETVSIPPVKGQEFDVRFRLQGGVPEGTKLRVYTDSSIEPVTEMGGLQSGDDAGIYYYYDVRTPEADGYYTLTFRTVQADCDGYVRLAAAQADNPAYSHCYKSAIVTRRNAPEEYAFNFCLMDGEMASPSLVLPYGEGRRVPLRITLAPLSGVNVADQLHSEFLISADCLEPLPGSVTADLLVPSDDGYLLSLSSEQLLQGGVIDLEMQTSEIVSAGPVSIREVSGGVLFSEETVTVTNSLLSGTVTVDRDGFTFGTSAPFITLEKADGTRIGSFSVSADPDSPEGSYRLTLYREYDFSADEDLAVIYSPLNMPDIYVAHTTVNELLAEDVSLVLSLQL